MYFTVLTHHFSTQKAIKWIRFYKLSIPVQLDGLFYLPQEKPFTFMTIF